MIWIESYGTVIGLIFAGIPILWGAFQFISIRRAELRQRQFENYHKLVRWFVQGDGDEGPYIDRQAAAAYEFRFYPRYYPVTLLIMDSMKEKARVYKDSHNAPSLYDQISETRNFIASYNQRPLIFRVFGNILF